MTAVRYWGSSPRHGLNPMDSRLAVPRNFFSLRETRLAVPRNFFSLRETRFRGDDGVFFRYRQIIRHSRVGKLFVIPGRRSRTRNPWGSSIRYGLNPMDPRFRGDDGGAVHGVRRSGTDSSPSGSSLRHGLNPMDPRFRGDDDAAVHGVRRCGTGLRRSGTDLTPWIPAWPFLETSSRCARLVFAGMTTLR